MLSRLVKSTFNVKPKWLRTHDLWLVPQILGWWKNPKPPLCGTDWTTMWAIREGKARGKGRYLDSGLYMLGPLRFEREPWVWKQTGWLPGHRHVLKKALEEMEGRLVWLVSRQERKLRNRAFTEGCKAAMAQARDFARECERDYMGDVGRGDLWAAASYIGDSLDERLLAYDLPVPPPKPIRSVWERLDDA